jgi:hypothetical protein
MDPTPQERPQYAELMARMGLQPDPWQAEVLNGQHQRLLLNCCRSAGKTTVVAVLSLFEALTKPGTLVLLLSRSHRQSKILYRELRFYYRLLGEPSKLHQTTDELELTNLSRIVCLPCSEETIRGYSNVSILVIDEAARVPDDLYKAVLPMLAVSDGRMICLSTPYGRRGFFYDAWARGGDDWKRFQVPAEQVPRIKQSYLEQVRRQMGESWYRQEFCCSFEALEGLVYPDFARNVVTEQPPAGGRLVGGIDFGLRNPFAAVWGVLDRNNVLWLTGEHFSRERSLSYHAQHMPKNGTWYADPAGAQEIKELHCAGFTVRRGFNPQRPGIAAVKARLEHFALRIVQGACPNLLAEAELYRYDPDYPDSEKPKKENDHALDALRYLVGRIEVERGRDSIRNRVCPLSSSSLQLLWPFSLQPLVLN